MPDLEQLLLDTSKSIKAIAKRVRHLEATNRRASIGAGIVGEGPGIDVIVNTVGLGGDTILLYDSGGNPVAEGAATDTGLATIIAVAASGDTIWLPSRTITLTASHTIPDGVTVKGMDRENTILSANGNIRYLLVLGVGSNLSNFSIDFTSTHTPASTTAIEFGNGQNRIQGLSVVHTPSTSNTNPCYAAWGFESNFTHISDCRFICDANGGDRYGLLWTSDSGAKPNHNTLTHVFGYGRINSNNNAAYGIRVDASGGSIIKVTDCEGVGLGQFTASEGYGIYATACILYDCQGYGNNDVAGSGTGYGLYLVRSTAHDCFGETTGEPGNAVSYGIYLEDSTIYHCDGRSGEETSYGIWSTGTSFAYFGHFQGITADIHVNAGTLSVYGVQYTNFAGAGDLIFLAGDHPIFLATEKSWAFMSRDANSGTNYIGGYYKFGATDNDFNPSITFGTANTSYAAHFFLVQAAGASGGTDTVIRVTGTTIDDQGNRTAAVDVDITVDDAGAADTYYETTEKWIGQVTIEKQSGPDLLCNYGFCKYWDNNNNDFMVAGFEATWLGAKNDATPDIKLMHHKATGWTYNNAAPPTPPAEIASMATDHNTEIEIRTDEEGAWKRDNLATDIDGSSAEGTLIELTTTTNRTYAIGNFLVRITPQ